MSNNRILDKIRKLLAMAGDTSSPNEATIAARQARSLMDKHQISEWHLRQDKEADFGKSDQIYLGSWHGMLGLAMAWLNDTNVRIVTEYGMDILRFEGYLVDAVTAKELWLYLVAQCEKQVKEVRGKNQKDLYRRGFAAGVQSQVKTILADREKLKTSTGQSLVICKRGVITQKYGAQQVSNSKRVSGENYYKGRDAGLKAGLSRQVNTGPSSKQLN